MNCQDIRKMLALDPTIADADVQTHVDACPDCARYRRQHHTIEVVLRAELRREAPETLTARLLAEHADVRRGRRRYHCRCLHRRPTRNR